MRVKYLEGFNIDANGKFIEIEGKGTIKQISFLAQNKYTTLIVIVDGEERIINNLFCSDFVNMPNSLIQIKETEYDYGPCYKVCSRLEFKFQKNIKIKLSNKSYQDKIQSFHVYYED